MVNVTAKYLIDGDQLSPIQLQRLLGDIGYKDGVGITIFHNGTFGKYNIEFCRQCKTTGVTTIEAPNIKNGADFLLISELTLILCNARTANIFVYTNDKSLAMAAKFIGSRYFTEINIKPICIVAV